ncbi:DUF6776 family protein [Shewanella sp. NIFS-20-20]|uniref:DUF6776 family protein n=1 Tax=Shewanella sp. NIFS-20-20 TaxID=2853806 RepID=UPI001C474D05|nr:DUF6776 family protein [Shewanella sp. NIFS-20-20]MBV7314269.1 hypothetical protein [Shewanella sp. NIFS-20-20]
MSNTSAWRRRLKGKGAIQRSSHVYMMLLVLVAFCLGVMASIFWQEVPVNVNVAEKKEIVRLRAELDQRSQQLASNNMALTVASQANQDMQQLFNEQVQQLSQVKRELAFYRSIMAPEQVAEGIAINTLEILPGIEPGQLQLQLVLTQLEKRKRLLKGKAEIRFIGLQDGKSQELTLVSLTGNSLDFNFRYFQILDSTFSLPEGFELKQIDAKIVVPATRWNKGAQAQQSFNAVDVLQGAQSPQTILEQNTQVIDNSEQQTELRGSND